MCIKYRIVFKEQLTRVEVFTYLPMNLAFILSFTIISVSVHTRAIFKCAKMSSDFVTLATLKEMLDIQDKANTFAFKMFVNDIKSKVKDIKKEVDELKQSVNFVSANHDDTNKNFEKIENEIRSAYPQINILCRTMDNAFKHWDLNTNT